MELSHFLIRPVFWVELIYSAVVIISCLIIYFKTREIYNISSYRGINYFSMSFLFFAVAYFFRFSFDILLRLFFAFNEFMPPRPEFRLGIVIYIYASTMAALYALYSVIWKRLGKTDFSWVLYLIALIVTIITGIIVNPLFHITTVLILFASAAIIGLNDILKSKGKHQHSWLYFAYTLILLLWIITIIATEIPRFMLEFRIVLYAISLGLFLAIMWRVLKVTGHKTK
jgi:hypothetical protein